jgi:hypothetical protein
MAVAMKTTIFWCIKTQSVNDRRHGDIGSTRFSKKQWVCNEVNVSFMGIAEELLEGKISGFELENRD